MILTPHFQRISFNIIVTIFLKQYILCCYASLSLSAQLACSMPAASFASRPHKPPVVAGATYSKGEWDTTGAQMATRCSFCLYKYACCVLGVQMAWIDTGKNGWTTPVQKRYYWTSRMNMLDWLNILTLMHRACCVWAEQKCDLWGLLEGWRLQWFLYLSRDGGRVLTDSSPKRSWWWSSAIFC